MIPIITTPTLGMTFKLGKWIIDDAAETAPGRPIEKG
jgi:hypothetical protein